MIRIPRIAFFRAEPAEHAQILTLLQRHEYSLREVEHCEEVRELILDEASPFDAMIVPMRLLGGGNGLNILAQIRASDDLADTPVLVPSTTRDKAAIAGIYSAGADVVLTQPFDPDLLFLQLSSLGRLKRAYEEHRRSFETNTALRDVTIQALNTTREGLLLLSPAQEITFCNVAGQMLLGMGWPASPEHLRRVTPQFQQALAQQPARGAQPQISERVLLRADGQSFAAVLRLTELLRADNYCSGYAVSFIDRSEVQFIADTFLQSRRMQSLALVGTAAAYELVRGGGGAPLPSFLSKLAEHLNQPAFECHMDVIVSVLLEALDPIISPRVGIKLSVPQGLKVAVRPSHLFELAGYLLFEAIEFTSLDGEVTILGEGGHDDGASTALIVSSECTRRQAFFSDDPLSKAIQQARTAAFSASGVSYAGGLGIGLDGAQVIADQYKTSVEYRQESAIKLRLRVKLPSRP